MSEAIIFVGALCAGLIIFAHGDPIMKLMLKYIWHIDDDDSDDEEDL